jgi:cytochrome c peroxidase
MYDTRLRVLTAFAGVLFVLAMVIGIALGTGPAGGQSPAPEALIATGRQLFNDATLSGSGATACASCHPSGGHTDNKTYVGLDVVADGDPNGRSTPTLWGAGERSAYGWAGTAPSLEANIRGIIVNRMKGAEPAKETLDALAAYVRSLPYPQDPQLDKDGTPLAAATAAVKHGFDLFVGDGGCGTCHVLPSFDKRGTEDVGTGGKFKVPSLRAVASTAPYFHDGRTRTLDAAVKFMWEFYAGKTGSNHMPSEAELADLVAYVRAL